MSYCKDVDNTYYNNYVETRLIVTYDVIDSSQPTKLYNYETYFPEVIGVNMFSKIEVDGIDVSVDSLDENQGEYQLSQGVHIAKYTLLDQSIYSRAFANCISIISVIVHIDLFFFISGYYIVCVYLPYFVSAKVRKKNDIHEEFLLKNVYGF